MTVAGEYQPSPWEFVADQVKAYEETGGKEGGTLEGKPCVILTSVGRSSGQLRKSPLMRVEHDDRYVVVASMGGAPKHPEWYLNVVANPSVTLQDGSRVMQLQARTATPSEKQEWWKYAVAAWPPFDEYQTKTTRDIPVVILEPAS